MKRLAFPVAIPEASVLGFAMDGRMRTLLGEPHVTDDGDGLGPSEYWAYELDCGLKCVIKFHRVAVGAYVCADEPEAAHIARHLGLADADWLPLQATTPNRDNAARWGEIATCVLRRQDDNGNVFDVTPLTSRRDAECFMKTLTARMHKQLYWIEDRGVS